MVTAAVDMLEVDRDATVMDIGFGGGIGIERLLECCPDGHVVGVDFSQEAVNIGERRFAKQIKQNRASFRCEDVMALSGDAATVDAVITTNTVYFWPLPVGGARQIERLLRPGGEVVIGYGDRDAMLAMGLAERGFTPMTEAMVVETFEEAGFEFVRTKRLDNDPKFAAFVTLMRKPMTRFSAIKGAEKAVARTALQIDHCRRLHALAASC